MRRRRSLCAARVSGPRRVGSPGTWVGGVKLKPEDQVDEIVDHYPEVCGGCGRGFAPE